MNTCHNNINNNNNTKNKNNNNNNNNNILRVNNLVKQFNSLMVVDDVSFTLGKGELVSLLGPSGSGKSTIFNIIAGLIKPDNGSVLIEGEDHVGKTGRVSYMHQKDLLLPWKKIIDNAALPLLIKGHSKQQAREKVFQYFSPFGLEGFEYKYPFQLSGGMRQRAALLRTYMMSNDIMLLDEPFGGLDAITKSKMHCWLLDVFSQLGSSILFISHDIEEAIFLSDRVYILSERPARVTDEIFIDFDRPRDRNIITTAKFNEIKANIMNLLQ